MQWNQQVRETQVGNGGSSSARRGSDNFSGIYRLQEQEPKKKFAPNFFWSFFYFFMFLRMVSGRCPPPRPLLAICREYQTSVMPGFSRLSAR